MAGQGLKRWSSTQMLTNKDARADTYKTLQTEHTVDGEVVGWVLWQKQTRLLKQA